MRASIRWSRSSQLSYLGFTLQSLDLGNPTPWGAQSSTLQVLAGLGMQLWEKATPPPETRSKHAWIMVDGRPIGFIERSKGPRGPQTRGRFVWVNEKNYTIYNYIHVYNYFMQCLFCCDFCVCLYLFYKQLSSVKNLHDEIT